MDALVMVEYQELCKHFMFSLAGLLVVVDDRDGWRGSVKEICADDTKEIGDIYYWHIM